MLIGLLGIVAGIVALVLLASTTNTLITERTREVAVMRALGGRQRPLRRRLRRIALAITGAALVIGLPLGIVISNLIARMVLEKFVGVTPDAGRRLAGRSSAARSACCSVRGSSPARAARRVTRCPSPRRCAIATARRSVVDASSVRWRSHPVGRPARRGSPPAASLRRPGTRRSRSSPSIATAVAARSSCPAWPRSVNAYNTAALEPWQLGDAARSPTIPACPFAQSIVAGQQRCRSRHLDVRRDRRLGDRRLRPDAGHDDVRPACCAAGRWFDPAIAARPSSVPASPSARTSTSATRSTVELASGAGRTTRSSVSPTITPAPSTSTAPIWPPTSARRAWQTSSGRRSDSTGDRAAPVAGPTTVDTAADVAARTSAGREAIVVIFGAIGVHRRRRRRPRSRVVDDRQPVRASPRAGHAAGASARGVGGCAACWCASCSSSVSSASPAGLALGALGDPRRSSPRSRRATRSTSASSMPPDRSR